MAKKKFLKTEAEINREEFKQEYKKRKEDKAAEKTKRKAEKAKAKEEDFKKYLRDTGQLKHRDFGKAAEADMDVSRALEEELRNSTYDFIEFSNQGNEWLTKTGYKEIEDSLSKQNNAYTQRMAMMCAAPLLRGFNVNGIVQTAGMFLGMSMFNKKLANNVKENIGMNLKNVNNPLIQKIGDKFLSVGGKRASYTPETAAMAKVSIVTNFNKK